MVPQTLSVFVWKALQGDAKTKLYQQQTRMYTVTYGVQSEFATLNQGLIAFANTGSVYLSQ